MHPKHPPRSLDGYQEVRDADFQIEVLDSSEVVIVEFYRDTCSSCHIFEPALLELRERYAGRFKFTRLNTDYGTFFQKKYKFEGEPTTAVFYRGELQGFVLGASMFDYFESELLKVLSAMTKKYNMPPITRVH